jgi:signal transduction histidine kinase
MATPARPGQQTLSRGDVVLACIALACMQVEVWGFWVVAEQGSKQVAAVLGGVMSAALAWSRTRPAAALAVVVGTHVLWTLVSVPQGSLVPFLIELVALFACAFRAPANIAIVGLAATVASEVFFVVRTTNDFADYMFILAFLAGAWTSGRALRSRQQRADALFARTVRLEVEKEEQARRARDEERSRIAREIHDVISHGVSVMVVQAAAAERVLDDDPESARAALLAVQDVGRDARVELRRMLGLMRAPTDGDLAPQPDLTRLPALLEQVRRAGLEVDVEYAGQPTDVPAGVALTAYRVIQEALTNALTHGAGSRAQLRLARCESALEIEVVNPAGPGAPSGGHGLVGMRERVLLYGGTLQHGREADGFFRLRVSLPVEGRAP